MKLRSKEEELAMVEPLLNAERLDDLQRRGFLHRELDVEGLGGIRVSAPVLAARQKITALRAPRLLKIAREWCAPFANPRSASNLELLAMNAVHAWRSLMPSEAEQQTWSELLTFVEMRMGQEIPPDFVGAVDSRFARSHPAVLRVFGQVEHFESLNPCAITAKSRADSQFTMFLYAWQASAFARLEIGHRLAASLCLTDVPPEVEVRAPWEAWSLVLPHGLFGSWLLPGGRAAPVARVWCMGLEPVIAVLADGTLECFPETGSGENGAESAASPEAIHREMLVALIRGACVALSNPDEFRKHRNRLNDSAANRHSGSPPFEQCRYLLSAPVKVDFRAHVAAALSGTRNGACPVVQFLVRGHWRQQAHGKQRGARKTIWIQPFWKGPEESRILLRHHRVDESLSRGAQ